MRIATVLIAVILASHFLVANSCKKNNEPNPEPGNTACASCKKINSAAELATLTLKAGDTVVMRSGDWVNERLIFKGTGTEQSPIVLMAEKDGQTILKGTSSLAIDGNWLVVNGLNFKDGDLGASKWNVVDFSSASENCRLTNTSITNYNPADPSIDYGWVSMNGKNNRLDHCYIQGKAHQGPTVVLWGANEAIAHRIDHNYFGSRPELGNNGGETIRVGTSTYYLSESLVVIEENIFDKCSGETEIISNKMSRNTIRNNLFFESKGTLCLRHGNNSEVYGNYIFGNNEAGTGGIRIIGEGHLVYNNYQQGIAATGQTCAVAMLDGVPNSLPNGYFQVKNVKVVGNTIVNCAQGFDIGAGKGGNNRTVPPANCTIANNLVQQKQGATLVAFTDTAENFIYEGNITYGMSAGTSLPAGFIEADPKLSITEYGTYSPSTGSPVFGAYTGTYPFFQSQDVGAKPLDETHKNLLNAKGIGPVWVNGLGNNLKIKTL